MGEPFSGTINVDVRDTKPYVDLERQAQVLVGVVPVR